MPILYKRAYMIVCMHIIWCVHTYVYAPKIIPIEQVILHVSFCMHNLVSVLLMGVVRFNHLLNFCAIVMQVFRCGAKLLV